MYLDVTALIVLAETLRYTFLEFVRFVPHMANQNGITGYSIPTVINYRYVCSVSPAQTWNRLNYPILSAALNENGETSGILQYL